MKASGMFVYVCEMICTALKQQSETSGQWRERCTDVSPSVFVLKLREGSWVHICSSHPDCRWEIHEQNRSSSPPLSPPVQTASYPTFPHLALLHFLHVFRWRFSQAERGGSTDDCVLNCSVAPPADVLFLDQLACVWSYWLCEESLHTPAAESWHRNAAESGSQTSGECFGFWRWSEKLHASVILDHCGRICSGLRKKKKKKKKKKRKKKRKKKSQIHL